MAVQLWIGWSRWPWSELCWQNLLARLPEVVQRHVLSYRRWPDRQRALLARILLLEGLLDLGAEADCLEALCYAAHGRPFIAGEVDFNLSHCGALVVCALCHGARLGVDVELLRDVDLNNYSLCMSAAQLADCRYSPQPSRKLLELWVAKESAAKACGLGFNTDFRQMIFDGDQLTVAGQPFWLQYLPIDGDYLCCLANSQRAGAPTLHYWSPPCA